MNLDYNAFDKKHSLSAIHKKNINTFRGFWQRIPKAQRIVLIVVAAILAPLILLMIIVPIIGITATGSLAAVITMTTIFTIIAILVIYSYKRIGEQLLRIEDFCKENSLSFSPHLTIGEQTGTIFNRGHSRVARNGIKGAHENNGFVVFEYQYTVGSGKNSHTYRFGVSKIRLNRKFPHIILDSREDGSISGLEFDNNQRLSLEGNFDKFFTVYGPKEYEIEVLQVLNPAVMQSLLEIKEPVDLEIIGDYLYIYNKGSLRKKHTFQAIFHAIEQITSSTRSVQKSFTMPEQIGDHKPILKKSKWPAIITILIIIGYIALQIVPRILFD